jgi:hypothetical protein
VIYILYGLPNEQWIAFFRTTPGLYYITNAIYKIKPNGDDSTLLLQLGATDTLAPRPVWTSDMKSICFIARIQDSLGIYKVKADGSGKYRKIYSFDTYGSVFDYWLASADSVSGILPLTLLNFSAFYQGKNVSIAWQTAQEINTSYFNIERSEDGKTFSKIGSVAAKGNNTVNNYSFVDNALPIISSQKVFEYRIKMVDKDGHFTYSKIASVNLHAASSISINPNPVKNILQVTGLSRSSVSNISITDISGKLVKRIAVESDNYLFDLSSLSCGNYFIRIEDSEKIINLKFIKE